MRVMCTALLACAWVAAGWAMGHALLVWMGAALALSGLVLWKSVQFPVLRELLGGYEFARRIHFFAMAAIVAFLVVHLVMVALVPRTLLTMIRGRAPKKS